MDNPKTIDLKRGAIPSPRHKLAAAMPHKIVGATPPDFLYNPPQLSFWGNNSYGNCVTAEEAFAKSCFNPEIFISDQEVIAWAKANGFLNGATIVSVLETMQADGFNQSNDQFNDGGHYSLNWMDNPTLQNAISIGPVKIGVSADPLHKVWESTNGWFATGLTSGTKEDHCVSICGYGTFSWLATQFGVQVPNGIDPSQPGYALFTWGSIGIIDVPSLQAITYEAWLRNPTTTVKPWIKVLAWNDNYFPGKGGMSEMYADTNPVICPSGQIITGIAFYQKGNRIAPKIQCSNLDGSNPTWLENSDWNGNYFPAEGGLSEIYADSNQLVCPSGKVITGFAFYQKGNRIAPKIQCSDPDGSNPTWLENSDWNNEYFPRFGGLSEVYTDTNVVIVPTGKQVIGIACYQKGNRIAPEILAGSVS